MKNYLMITACFFSSMADAQLHDDFSDGNFTTNPVWSGSSGLFVVNTSLQLQSNNSAAGRSYLSTAFQPDFSDSIVWRTIVRQSFSPSGSNYGRIYLTSDAADLTTSLHGYYLQFGEPGSNDAIELFRQDGMTSVSVCRARTGAIASSFLVGVEVIRLSSGRWQVSVDYTGSSNFIREAIGIDSIYTMCSWFGVLCVYTASNASKFFYDDFSAGPAMTNVPPPAIQRVLRKDLIITEILADPIPAIGLPEQEYIELYNRSQHTIDLSGWTLSGGVSIAFFSRLLILPGNYEIVCSSDAIASFVMYSNAVGVDGFPSLNNDGDDLILKDKDGAIVDSVNYSVSWYHDADKQNGGWSLELIDVNNPCGQGDNWIASEDPRGGTPGAQNSVKADKPDVDGPRLLRIAPRQANLLELTFNEPLSRAATTDGVFNLVPPVGIGRVSFSDPSMTSVLILLKDELDSGILYSITAQHITDCAGNALDDKFGTLSFALPQNADSLDILINEILFNPRPSGVDFVEIYNNSKKFIDLQGWKLANYDDGALTNPMEIAVQNVALPPLSYLAFTEDSVLLKNNYPLGHEQNFIVTSLPSFPDDNGSVALVTAKGKIIDYFLYDAGFHTKLLKNVEGVSLERVSTAQPTNEPQNWKSASSVSGFATPGYLNSSSRADLPVPDENITVDPTVISPGSGYQEFARINYHFSTSGYAANLRVVDQQGRLIRTLGNNEILGTEGFFRWDGDRDDGSKARIGFYLVVFDVFDIQGMSRTFRKRIVIAAK